MPLCGSGTSLRAVALTLSGHTDAATSAEWSPDGTTILTASNDGTARLWDSATGQVRLILRGHTLR